MASYVVPVVPNADELMRTIPPGVWCVLQAVQNVAFNAYNTKLQVVTEPLSSVARKAIYVLTRDMVRRELLKVETVGGTSKSRFRRVQLTVVTRTNASAAPWVAAHVVHAAQPCGDSMATTTAPPPVSPAGPAEM